MQGLNSAVAQGVTVPASVLPAEKGETTSVRITRRRLRWKTVAYTVSIAIWLALFLDGYSYYSTPYAERPHHADYRELRPAGPRGLLFGIVGASMMVLMLVPLSPQRSGKFQPPGFAPSDRVEPDEG